MEGVARSAFEHVGHVEGEDKEQEEAVGAVDDVVGGVVDDFVIGDDEEGDGREQENGHVEMPGLAFQWARGDECHDARNEQYVKDVAAEDVAHGELGFAFEGGGEAHGEVGHGRAEGDDGEADDKRRDAPSACDGDGAFGDPVAAEDDGADADDNEK